jgi:hypothetical protein
MERVLVLCGDAADALEVHDVLDGRPEHAEWSRSFVAALDRSPVIA